jgi:hypothetical protein
MGKGNNKITAEDIAVVLIHSACERFTGEILGNGFVHTDTIGDFTSVMIDDLFNLEAAATELNKRIAANEKV